ncbi:Y-family DNA polymerase [Chitinophaga sp. NPDC101104]|uniref:Y-family DNA polymerase n=1 Tax=Chitinophaga sp. NPDC101104 TaxID=3390561 RepID=UPI003D0220CB
MEQRYVSIWFRHLLTDWMAIRTPALAGTAFVFTTKDRGRNMVSHASAAAQSAGIAPGMLLTDARARVNGLQDFELTENQETHILQKIANWCLRFTPAVALDAPDGLLLNVTGCAHLWGGEAAYLSDLMEKLTSFGYILNAGMAPSPGSAWAIARFGSARQIVPNGDQLKALLSLPPAALRLEQHTVNRLYQLGLERIEDFIKMPRPMLRRRFGPLLLTRIDQALGYEAEPLTYIQPPVPYNERLPCLEPIMTATGVTIALERLLEHLCARLQAEGQGLRKATLLAYRIDGKTVSVQITSNHASSHAAHLLHLFSIRIPQLEPGPGIETFVLQAERVQSVASTQEGIWRSNGGLQDVAVAEMLDRVSAKLGPNVIGRYLPQAQHWPEQSYRVTDSLTDNPSIAWPEKLRPVSLLAKPQPITVTAPIPDYPPMLFIMNGKIHTIKKADGPERIERAWWTDTGEHRDYYIVEDHEGRRFWIFRLGHYDPEKPAGWFVHGYFP